MKSYDILSAYINETKSCSVIRLTKKSKKEGDKRTLRGWAEVDIDDVKEFETGYVNRIAIPNDYGYETFEIISGNISMPVIKGAMKLSGNKKVKENKLTVLSGERCAACGSKDIDYSESEPMDGQIKYPYTCSRCGAEGEEWYNIEFVINKLEGDEKEN